MGTELRSFSGLDGSAGSCRDQKYILRFEILKDDQVRIELNHTREGVESLVVSGAQFKEWFKKQLYHPNN